MAFCNSCGTAMDAGAKFCLKCGAPAGPAGGAVVAAPVAAVPAKGSSAVKIILIVLAVIIGLGILGVGTTIFFVHRMVSRSHIREHNGNVHVETPFGDINTTTNPAETAQNLGVDLYPGATMVKDGAANMNIGNLHTSAVELETSDPGSSVAQFYQEKFPKAMATSSPEGRYSIVSRDKNNLFTITIEPHDGKTRIHIAKMTGKMVGDSN